MKLIPNAKAVLRHAWSCRLALVAAFTSSMEAFSQFYTGGNGWPALGVGALAFFSAVSRIVLQEVLHDAPKPDDKP